jgi:threonine/homoserine/homoserine lactone efflux protein
MDWLTQVILLFKGIGIGFAVAAPVGPIGALCVRRTLADGKLAGFVSGLGAALADAIYGLAAAILLSYLRSLFEEIEAYKNEISVVGGFLLLGLGYVELRAKPIDPAAGPPTRLGLIGHFFTTMFWTLSNPITILTFITIFSIVEVAGPSGQIGSPEREFAGITALVVGVGIGSTLWWLVLTQGVGMFRHHFFGAGQTTRWPNFMAGVFIIACGIYALSAIRHLI